MKKLCMITAFVLLCLNQAQAKKVRGYFISKLHDTTYVTFKIPVKLFGEINYEALQWKVKYYDLNDEKITIKPATTSEIGFNYGGQKVRMLSRTNNLGMAGSIFMDNSYFFLRLITDGDMQLFTYYYTQRSGGGFGANGMATGGGSYTVEKEVLQKKNGQLYRPTWISFRKDMMDYISDCPSLVKKIDDRLYRSGDILQIVNDYNRNCK